MSNRELINLPCSFRKQERDAEARRAEKRARQVKRARKDMDDRDAFFGETIGANADQQGGRPKGDMNGSADPHQNGFGGSSMDSDSSDSD
jgi:membrane protein involved in colicin uptake